MSKWGKLRKKIKKNAGKIAGAVISYYYGGAGSLFSIDTYLKTGRNYAAGKEPTKKAYNYYTGHYARQQERIEKNQQRAEQREIERQERQALQQRKEQINELRERNGVGGTRYRTTKQERMVKNSIYSSGHNVETLG